MSDAIAEVSISAFVAALVWSQSAAADTAYLADAPPGVTLELCSDVDIDEVQNAIAIEYLGEDDGQTMITVACSGATATVRVVGPSHPRGRIVDIDLTGVDPVAMPRTIALVASELWTAPSVSAPPVYVGAEADASEVLVDDSRPQNASFRDRPAVGVGVTTVHRDIVAGRLEGTQSARGSFAAWSLKADWPVFSRLGFFYAYTQSGSRYLEGLEELNAAVQWRKGEGGLYVPLWTGRFRLDVRASGGNESYTPQNAMNRGDTRSMVLPDYEFFSIGADLAYAVDAKTLLMGWATSNGVVTDDKDFQTLAGYRMGVGLSNDVAEQVRIDCRAEAIHLDGDDRSTGLFYADDVLSLELGIHYRY